MDSRGSQSWSISLQHTTYYPAPHLVLKDSFILFGCNLLRTSIHYEIVVPVNAPFTIGGRKNSCTLYGFYNYWWSYAIVSILDIFRVHSVLGECFNAV